MTATGHESLYWQGAESPAPSPFVQAAQPEGQQVIWKPQPGPQTALIQCPVFEVFFGGARGGGKTEASIGDWLEHSNTYGEHAVGLFIRRKLTQLSEVIARTKILFSKLGAKYNEQQKTWTMANGARLKFAYLERDSDADEYQGHSYTRLYVEEMPNFPSPVPIMKLKATLRSAAGVPCMMRATGNPGGPGHKWVKHRYIDPNPKGYQVVKESEEVEIDGKRRMVEIDRVFIPSRITDNKLLMENDPTYVLRLKQAGSEALVKAWLNGDWNIIDGAFFDEFDPLVHILPHKFAWRIPSHAKRFRAFDWGSARPFSVGWYVISDGTWGLPRDALLKYREWYGSKGPNVGLKLPANEVARGIIERERGEDISYGVADPSIYIENGGPSIADMMAKEGCYWRKADNRRENGWQLLRWRLKGSAGRPLLYFLETCTATIETLPTLQHDKDRVEDIDTDSEDHAGDETRYACASRPWIPDDPRRQPDPFELSRHPDSDIIYTGTLTMREMVENARRKRLADS